MAVAFLCARVLGDGAEGPLRSGWSSIELLSGPVLAGVSLLMLCNWGLEARKWQALMGPIQRLPFGRAFWATLAGTSIGLITPNRVGEFVGRVLFLDPEHRVEGSFASLLGSIAQFVVTLLIGGLALPFGQDLIGDAGSGWAWRIVASSAFLIGCAAVLLYFSPKAFGRLMAELPLLRRYERHARVLDTFDRSLLMRVFAISAVRYAVFTLQFAWLLHAVAEVDFGHALLAVPVVFLITTLVPTTVLTELGVRGSVAVFVVEGDPVPVAFCSALIWIINIVAPALAGAVALLLARIRTRVT